MSFDINNKNQKSIIYLPMEVICYLAFNFLTYESARNLMEVVILKTYKINLQTNNSLKIAEYACSFYKNNNLSTMYKKLIDQKPKIVAKANISFYFSYLDGWLIWGKGMEDTNKLQLIKNENILAIAVGEYHKLFLTEKGKVYGYGGNLSGQLGLNHGGNQDTPQLITALQDIKIIAVAASSYHSFFLTKDNKVYGCGVNTYGQLALADYSTQFTPQPILALLDKKIIAMAAGYSHSLFLSDMGKVYCCGENAYGQLGLGHKNWQTRPTLVSALQDKKIIAIVTGNIHSLFLTNEGKVYSCGYNSHGQLGLGHSNEETTPQLITAFKDKKIIAIAVGDDYSLFLTVEGEVYSCGKNSDGQLGLGHTSDQETPQLIISLKNKHIVAITAGSSHSLFMTIDGELYGCGKSADGQLGINIKEVQTVPQQITFPLKNHHLLSA